MSKEYDYRRDYFRRHKGLFNLGIYFCSYCGKPIFNKKNSHIDHIIPQSKSKTLFNRSYNTTISCAKCNLKKSDKIDFRVVQGYASKWGGAAVGGAVGGSYKVARGTVKGAGKAGQYGAKGFGWLIGQMFGGILSTVKFVLSAVIKALFKNWVVTLIVGYIIFSRYY